MHTTITGIAAGGAGVGRLPDGRAVFVHRTAPGDEVEVRITQQKRRWARGSLERVLEPGPDRRPAPCPHYDGCGGCTMEHMTYTAQLRAKSSIVAEAMRRIGRLDVAAPVVTPAPAEFRYRNRVSFTLVRAGGGRVIAGFHALEEPDRIVDITGACLLPEAAVGEAWNQLRSRWGPDANRLPSGDRLRLTLRASAAGDAALHIDGGYGPGQPETLLAAVPRISAIWQRRARDGSVELLAGRATMAERWDDEDIELSGTVFLQVNRAAASLLEAHVLEQAGDVAGKHVIDAYCGLGLHARRLARLGARVSGIEQEPDAMAAARRGASDVAWLEGPVEVLLPEALPADLVILNPPRAGLSASVCDVLLATPPARILYVSCDPATLARDLVRLGGRYVPRSMRCFDLFPQTAHVETVVELACVTS